MKNFLTAALICIGITYVADAIWFHGVYYHAVFDILSHF